ncbi:probable salivary secreted peptide [Anopheles ziemanni]|uniref:probable salivary secreted peptide n=1 Tax=Anopheles coustani TaxID=139045 RepID=UPI002658AE25|nr:probable salivary secreted peptide [Anopheles coustani]XP_058171353.1 probable salivary secreted peptide [Anopheles ziemanni]
MKCATIFTVLAVLGVSSLAVAQTHNYFFGSRVPYDTLVNQTTAIQTSSFLRVKTVDVEYPLKGQRGRNITAIYVYDRLGGGRGGFASIIGGGIGQNYTRIHLKTQRGNGMNFQVEIYGR